jgi:hypothetical protein
LSTKFHKFLGNERIKEIIQNHGLGPEEEGIVEEFLKILEKCSVKMNTKEKVIWDKIQSSPKKKRIMLALVEINGEWYEN